MKTAKSSGVTISTKYFKNKEVKSRIFLLDGKLHRETADGPAWKTKYKDGTIKTRSFYINGSLHRPISDGPASVAFGKDGEVLFRRYYLNGQIVLDEEVEAILNPKPTIPCKEQESAIDEKLSVTEQTMKLIGQSEAATKITFHKDGKLKSRIFRLDGKLDRDPSCGPAAEYYYEDGNVRSRHYYQNGKRHRPAADGPALQRYERDGSVFNAFFLYGWQLSVEQVQAALRLASVKLITESEVTTDNDTQS